jgi:hypothetical protein
MSTSIFVVGVVLVSKVAFLFLLTFADVELAEVFSCPPAGTGSPPGPNTEFELTTIVSVKFDVVNFAIASLFRVLTSFSCDCLMISVVGIAAGDSDAARVVFEADEDVEGLSTAADDDLLVPIDCSSSLLVFDDFELLS